MQPNDLYEIYSFYEPAWYENLWITIPLIVAIVLVLVTAGILFLRRKKKLTPWQHAINQLNALIPEKFTARDQFKTYYFTVTTITKQYLDTRFNWNLQSKTDEEMVIWLTETHAQPTIIEPLKQLVEHMHMVKFANVDAIKSEALSDKEALINLIRTTIPTA